MSEANADSQRAAAGSYPGGSVGHRPWLSIRRPISPLGSLLLACACVAVCLLLWWLATRGPAEERWISPLALPSPAETVASFHSLWYERALARNLWVTLRRVALGFSLAVVVGVPVGVVAGCFPAAQAFLQPLVLFGRNIPIAALIPLTFFLFSINEFQKVMFIFLACVAFVISDTAAAVRDVGQQYLDTAYTLGARRWATITKVLVPLALPAVFDSLRILFGLAFGYIMLSETIKIGDDQPGIGNLILTSQRIGPRAHIILIILIIPLVALLIDRVLYWCQRQLFPHRFGGAGLLREFWHEAAMVWEGIKSSLLKPIPPYDQLEVPAEAKKLIVASPEEIAELRRRWQP